MACTTQILCVIVFLLVFILVVVLSHTAMIVRRDEWGARAAKQIDRIDGPVPYVIIHHSYLPAACWTSDDCKLAMRNMQDYHQLERGWNDIGYNFGIGGDGRIYEGRGFDVEGAHAPSYNNRSIGICVIGDWRVDLPSANMLEAVQRIIRIGVSKGHVRHNYTLLGHRQTRPTECPGERLFNEIATWSHFVNLPTVPAVDANANSSTTTTTTTSDPNIIETLIE